MAAGLIPIVEGINDHPSLLVPEITAELPDWAQEGDVWIIQVQRFGEGIIDEFEMQVMADGDRLIAQAMRPDPIEEVEPL